MKDILTAEKLANISKIIPVVVLDDITHAVPLAKALLAGGVGVMEVTLRTDVAFGCIEEISKHVPEMIVGAGSIISDDQYHQAVKMGSKFIISPGLINDLVRASNYYDVPFIPGVATPSEVMKALVRGFTYLKFFPAEASNGLEIIKSLQGPISQAKFCPTGGIGLQNMEQYYAQPNVFAVGCSFIVDKALVRDGDFAKITELCKQTVSILNQVQNN